MKRKLLIISIIVFAFFIFVCSKSYATWELKGLNQYYRVDIPDNFQLTQQYYWNNENPAIGDFSRLDWSEKGVSVFIWTIKKDIGIASTDNKTVLNGCTRGDMEDAYLNDKNILAFKGFIDTYDFTIFCDGWGDTYYGNPGQRAAWLYTNRNGLYTEYIVKDVWAIESDDYITQFYFYWTGKVTGSFSPNWSAGSIDDWFWNSDIAPDMIDTFEYKVNNTKYVCNIPFEDVFYSNWYCEAVRYSYKNNIISGYDPYTFAPRDNLTREQLVALLWRIEGQPDASALPNNFTDVPNGQWYTDAIKWANANGIVKGYGGTTLFGRGDKIIRQDLAIMLSKYAEFKGKNMSTTATLNAFKDKNKVSNYAQDAIKWAIGNGIISGNTFPDGTKTIAPHDNATRAEAAVMLYRFCENVLK